MANACKELVSQEHGAKFIISEGNSAIIIPRLSLTIGGKTGTPTVMTKQPVNQLGFNQDNTVCLPTPSNK